MKRFVAKDGDCNGCMKINVKGPDILRVDRSVALPQELKGVSNRSIIRLAGPSRRSLKRCKVSNNRDECVVPVVCVYSLMGYKKVEKYLMDEPT